MSQPMGLPNIGNSCWLNSVLQVIFHCNILRQNIMTNTKMAGAFHHLIITLIEAIESRNTHAVIEGYRHLHSFIIQSNSDFAQFNALNDSHEVLTFLLNKLHEEAGKMIPSNVLTKVSDPVSMVIMRDFNNKISNILETFVSVTSRQASDNSTIYETFSTLFIDPKYIDPATQEARYNIQIALNGISFHNLPRCMFISLIMEPNFQCQVPDELVAQTVRYHLRSIIFFLPHMRHYITALRGMLDDKLCWCVLNDAQLYFVDGTQLAQLGVPTLILYEQV